MTELKISSKKFPSTLARDEFHTKTPLLLIICVGQA